MLNVSIDLEDVEAALDTMPVQVRAALETKIYELTVNLQHHVIADKLQGQVLHHHSGKLGRSIQMGVFDEGPDRIVGEVFSSGDVKYAAIHEYGGTIPAHDIVPSKAQALAFAIGGKAIFAKIVHMPAVTMPERSFLRSSLADQAADIASGLKMAALDAARESLNQR